MYKPIGVRQSNWQLSQNNQYVSYALLSWMGSIFLCTFKLLHVEHQCHWGPHQTKTSCINELNTTFESEVKMHIFKNIQKK